MSKRKWLTLEEKVLVLEEQAKSPSKLTLRVLAQKFGVGKSQISSILKDKDAILQAWLSNGTNPSMKKRMRKAVVDVDTVVYDWVCTARLQNLPISGPLIQEKALETAKTLGLEDFKASNGWLDKFKIRHNISSKARGESLDLPQAADDWKKHLKLLCAGYSDRDIFNSDETCLRFKALPTLRDMDFVIEEESPDMRLTILLCANMAGELEEPLIISSDERPQDTNGLNKWKTNRFSWMTSEIMTEWLNGFNLRMKEQHRRVLLFLDNNPCHRDMELSNVKLVFILPNSSSVCQPVGMGIIKCFKQNFRKMYLRHVISKIESGLCVFSAVDEVSVLDAIGWIKGAISSISPSIVSDCFKKAGFTDENVTLESYKKYEDEELEELVRIIPNSCWTGDRYATCDDHLPTSSEDADFEGMIGTLPPEPEVGEHDISDEDPIDRRDDVSEDELPAATFEDALGSLEVVERYLASDDSTPKPAELLRCLKNFKSELIKYNKSKSAANGNSDDNHFPKFSSLPFYGKPVKREEC